MAQRQNERKRTSAEGVDQTPIPLVRARDILGTLANRVEFRDERIIITRRGKASFALVPIKDYEKLSAA